MNVSPKADNFLRQNGLHPDNVRPGEFKASYISEMKAGLAGHRSSLLMLPSYLPSDIKAREGEKAMAVDIGGTNLKIAALRFEDGCFKILASDVSPVPGRSGEISREAFFGELARRLLPFAGAARRIGICFSHAAEILPDLDGRLISFSKEIRVRDAAGVRIARELSGHLAALGIHETKTYTLINDSAATLLGGAANGGMIGFVLGTGMNLSYIEKTDVMTKLSGGYSYETMLINTETGNFDAMPLGPVDRAFDDETADPGSHRLEKMTGGKYLGDLILFTLKKAAAEGLLTAMASSSVLALDELPTPEAGAFLDGNPGALLDSLSMTADDRAFVTTVTDSLLDRAAKLSALAITSVLEKTDTGCDASSPAVIIAEGSTVNKLYSFRERFTRYLQELCHEAGRHSRVITVADVTLKGAALASMARD